MDDNPIPFSSDESIHSTLKVMLDKYEEAISKLCSASADYAKIKDSNALEKSRENISANLLSTIWVRNGIANEVADNKELEESALKRLLSTDAELRQSSLTLTHALKSKTLIAWRDSIQPPATSWWWYIDRVAADQHSKTGVGRVLLVLTGLMIPFCIVIAGDLITRFTIGGPDTLGLVATGAQILLTFVAGSTFTEAGRQWLNSIYETVNIAQPVRSYLSLFTAFFASLALLIWKLYLPNVSDDYYTRGFKAREKSDIVSAVSYFRRSIALNPDNVDAHYELGSVYIDVQDYDKAIPEFLQVVMTSKESYDAYDQLALCYIFKGSDYNRALEALFYASRSEDFANARPDIKYAIYKNIGWALWGTGKPQLAQVYINRALNEAKKSAPPRQGAEAHAILAQIFQDAKTKDKASHHWQLAAHPSNSDSISTYWRTRAMENSP